MITETDLLTELDFDLTLPCEHSGHGHPAWWGHSGAENAKYLLQVEKCCGSAIKLTICELGFQKAVSGTGYVRCLTCGCKRPWYEAWTILKVL